MTTTPPLRIATMQEPPPTPRHGAWHDDFIPRYITRSSQKNALRNADQTPETPSKLRARPSVTTPESHPFRVQPQQHNFSPPLSPQKSPDHNLPNGFQVLSPGTPSSSTRSRYASSLNPSFLSGTDKRSFSSESTTINQGMLPTPVKTPRKKKAPDGLVAGRALFQELPSAHDDIMPTPRKGRKSKRHNGFSLGCFDSTGEGDGRGIHIFTDSRDMVPELDQSEDNPFLERSVVRPSTTRGSRTSKRRKLVSERQKDDQVEEAIQKDNGMVYVFRGKKIFKHFNDHSDDAETNSDANDIEALGQDAGSIETQNLLKPLTRKSIKPRRLFQTETQKREFETKQAEQELTDIEEGRSVDFLKSSKQTTGATAVNRRSSRNAAVSSSQDVDRNPIEATAGLREDEPRGRESPTPAKAEKPKSGSLFDSWKRVKSAKTPTPVTQSKGRKRAASVLGESEEPAGVRKLRSY